MPHINTTNDKQNHDADRIIKHTWEKIVHFVEYKTHWSSLPKTAEDITAEALEFAVRNDKITWNDATSAEVHLLRTAKMAAKWRIYSEIKKARRSLVSYELDNTIESEDGEHQELPKAESDRSVALHHEKRAQEIRKEHGRRAFAKLDGFLSGKGVSNRDICIFKDWFLYKKPTDTLCRKYNITSTNVHKIVCVVKSIIATEGRSLLRHSA